jgi:streptogramin lyase
VQPSGLGLTKVVTGPDGDLWGYLQYPSSAYFIDKITPGGVVSALYTAVGAIDDIVAGPDGDVWFATTGGFIGEFSPTGR